MDKIKAFAENKLEQFGLVKQSQPPPAAQPAQQAPADLSQNTNLPQTNEEPSQPSPPPPTAEQGHSAELDSQNSNVAFQDSPIYTLPAFLDAINEKVEERGDTSEEQKYWSYPRRWIFTISGITLENYNPEPLTCFIEFKIGGTRTECRVQSNTGSEIRILHKGENKNSVRTPIVDNVTTTARQFDFTYTDEYRGSYLDLEVEKFSVRLWRYRRFSINVLEGMYEDQLLNIAKGHVKRKVTLKADDKPRAKLLFSISFQELYDFELSFLSWSAHGIFSSSALSRILATKGIPAQEKMAGRKGRAIRSASSGHSWFGRLMGVFHISHGAPRGPIGAGDREGTNLAPTGQNSEEMAEIDQKISGKADYAEHLKEITNHAASELCSSSFVILRDLDALKMKFSSSFQLRVKLKGNGVTIGNSLKSAESKSLNNTYAWENLGEIYYRGTRSELEKCVLQISVVDIQGKNKNTVASCHVPLRVVVDHPTVKKDFEPPLWLVHQAKLEKWTESLSNINFGYIQGMIQVCNVPRYRQKTTFNPVVLHESATNGASAYIVANVALDQLVADQKALVKMIGAGLGRRNGGDFSAQLFAELSWMNVICSENFDLRISNGSCVDLRANQSACEMAIGVDDIMGSKPSELTISSAPVIRLDIYARAFLADGAGEPEGTSQLSCRVVHLGGNSVSPAEIFYTSKGALRQKISKAHSLDLPLAPPGHSKRDKLYETRGFTEQLPLVPMGATATEDLPCVQFSLWTYPQVQIVTGERRVDTRQTNKGRVVTGLNRQYKSFYMRCSECWVKAAQLLGTAPLNLECTLQDGQLVFVQSLLVPIMPPSLLDNPNFLFQFILSIPFRSDTSPRHVQTPYFTLKLRRGNLLDHAILFACLLLGLSRKHDPKLLIPAGGAPNLYACGRLAVDIAGETFFFDVASGTRTSARSRGANTAPPGYIITSTNAYMVIRPAQGDSISDMIAHSYSFFPCFEDDKSPFCLEGFAATSCWHFDLAAFSGLMPQSEAIATGKILEMRLEKAINTHRSAQNLQTRWNKDSLLCEYLAKGSSLLFRVKSSVSEIEQIARAEFCEWKEALCSKVPPSHQIICRSFTFLDTNVGLLMDTLKANMGGYIDSRDDNASFSHSVSVFALPSGLIVVYLMFLISVKIHERDRRKLVYMERLRNRTAPPELISKKSNLSDMLEESPEALKSDECLNRSKSRHKEEEGTGHKTHRSKSRHKEEEGTGQNTHHSESVNKEEEGSGHKTHRSKSKHKEEPPSPIPCDEYEDRPLDTATYGSSNLLNEEEIVTSAYRLDDFISPSDDAYSLDGPSSLPVTSTNGLSNVAVEGFENDSPILICPQPEENVDVDPLDDKSKHKEEEGTGHKTHRSKSRHKEEEGTGHKTHRSKSRHKEEEGSGHKTHRSKSRHKEEEGSGHKTHRSKSRHKEEEGSGHKTHRSKSRHKEEEGSGHKTHRSKSRHKEEEGSGHKTHRSKSRHKEEEGTGQNTHHSESVNKEEEGSGHKTHRSKSKHKEEPPSPIPCDEYEDRPLDTATYGSSNLLNEEEIVTSAYRLDDFISPSDDAYSLDGPSSLPVTSTNGLSNVAVEGFENDSPILICPQPEENVDVDPLDDKSKHKEEEGTGHKTHRSKSRHKEEEGTGHKTHRSKSRHKEEEGSGHKTHRSKSRHKEEEGSGHKTHRSKSRHKEEEGSGHKTHRSKSRHKEEEGSGHKTHRSKSRHKEEEGSGHKTHRSKSRHKEEEGTGHKTHRSKSAHKKRPSESYGGNRHLNETELLPEGTIANPSHEITNEVVKTHSYSSYSSPIKSLLNSLDAFLPKYATNDGVNAVDSENLDKALSKTPETNKGLFEIAEGDISPVVAPEAMFQMPKINNTYMEPQDNTCEIRDEGSNQSEIAINLFRKSSTKDFPGNNSRDDNSGSSDDLFRRFF
ncbi:hypothetical protein BmR1_04g09040 [Babesia microti strain RI]|uniref:Centrosomal protein of 76 kDa C-terminal domain-containing protein n=1 Tax=Babesia microti (strain RI) TaxID=1133968 RepID=I7J9P7_BABMR|nr:hypothetical protein BmR1_04g09040 [Babesia microti strain RI]CCF75983.1 hypothetical protein BmR1_04g09040 [Babesia microti strain RI]|eukprot:XP_012650391.1 hypothetical protein BmR1_04g09040 [Babesia microti strain RI]